MAKSGRYTYTILYHISMAMWHNEEAKHPSCSGPWINLSAGPGSFLALWAWLSFPVVLAFFTRPSPKHENFMLYLEEWLEEIKLITYLITSLDKVALSFFQIFPWIFLRVKHGNFNHTSSNFSSKTAGLERLLVCLCRNVAVKNTSSTSTVEWHQCTENFPCRYYLQERVTAVISEPSTSRTGKWYQSLSPENRFFSMENETLTTLLEFFRSCGENLEDIFGCVLLFIQFWIRSQNEQFWLLIFRCRLAILLRSRDWKIL